MSRSARLPLISHQGTSKADKMIARRLPPFQSILAFECVARLGSVRRAADELCLTPPAVTYRIKELEEFLGFVLFSRTGAGIEISQAGTAYLKTVQPVIAELERGTRDLRASFGADTLRIQVLPVMASLFVIPGLNSFLQEHPDIRLLVDTDHELVDLNRESLHLCIRFGNGDWPGLWATPLLPIAVTPVCSPSFAQQHDWSDPAHLTHLPRLGLAREEHSWPRFLKAHHLTLPQNATEIRFGEYRLAIDAAVAGLGVALGVLPLLQPLINAGQLIAPLPLRLTIPEQYWLVAAEQPAPGSAADRFAQWLLQQAKALVESVN